jgi:sterol O-acyltransferase
LDILNKVDCHYYFAFVLSGDWWNSRTWARYYRTWNIVVHDWLYAYLYRDVYLLLGAKRKVSRAAAMSIVFLISAIFHEYIIAVVMGFFYPVLFFSFMGAGFAFVFLTEKGNSPLWNIFMWFCLFVGTGVILCLMTIEWFARKNCQPIAGNPALDFFIPRSWTCVPVDAS